MWIWALLYEPVSSLVEGGDGSHLHNCQINLLIALYTLSLLFFMFINTTTLPLGQIRALISRKLLRKLLLFDGKQSDTVYLQTTASNYLSCSCFYGHLVNLLLRCTSGLNMNADLRPVLALFISVSPFQNDCDQMTKLCFQYLAIFNNENVPIRIQNCAKVS